MTERRTTDVLRTAVERRLGIDARALAAFRIGIGSLLVVDLLLRARDLTAFYTDAGVFPRSALAEGYPLLWRLSIHALSGETWFQAGLFVAAAVAAVSLAVGYRTRVSAVVSWTLLASLHLRNPYVLNGGDNVLLVALFLGLFLPLDRRWSVDAVGRDGIDARNPGQRDRVLGFATAAILSQIVLLYWTNAVFKLRGDLWSQGVAVRYVFELERFTVFLGEYLADAPVVLEAVNWLWLALLVCSPLLLAATDWVRTGVVAAFVAGHVGMLLTMGLGLFPVIVIVCLLLFVPPREWDRVERRFRPSGRRLAGRVESSRVAAERAGRRRPSMGRDGTRLSMARHAIRRSTPVVTAAILVVGLVWQGAAVGVVETHDVPVVDSDPDGWKLFAPEPPRARGWYVISGDLEDGSRVDLYPNGNTSRRPPPDTGETYPNRRWRKYLTRVRQHPDVLAPSLAAYVCSSGETRYGRSVDAVTIEYVREPVRFDGEGERTTVDIGTYTCPVVQ